MPFTFDQAGVFDHPAHGAAGIGARSQQGGELGTPSLFKRRDEVDQSNEDDSCVVAVDLFEVQNDIPDEQKHIFGEYIS